MTVIKYAVKHYFTNNEEIKKIAEEIKKNNDKYLETIIMSQTPAIIEKIYAFTNKKNVLLTRAINPRIIYLW